MNTFILRSEPNPLDGSEREHSAPAFYCVEQWDWDFESQFEDDVFSDIVAAKDRATLLKTHGYGWAGYAIYKISLRGGFECIERMRFDTEEDF